MVVKVNSLPSSLSPYSAPSWPQSISREAIRVRRSSIELSMKGVVLVSIENRMTPTLQLSTSESYPLLFCCVTTSGARYEGVPHMVCIPLNITPR
jgi:hypothetical protein